MAKSKDIFITMNLKKLIREEMDSFKWVSDIPDMDNYNNVYFIYNGVRYHIMDRGGDNVIIYDDKGSILPTPNSRVMYIRSGRWPRELVNNMFISDKFVLTQGD